jgi:hypothetical protein
MARIVVKNENHKDMSDTARLDYVRKYLNHSRLNS